MPAPTSAPHSPGQSGFPLGWRGAQALLLPRGDGAAAADVPAQAIALEPLLPLVDVLAAWLGEAVRLQAPAPLAAADADGFLSLAIGRQGEAPLCDLALPAAQLRHAVLGPLGAGWAVRWPRIVCDMLLDEWPLDALDAARFEPGALLLLPRSFGVSTPNWRVRLLACSHGLAPGSRSARWCTGERVLSLAAHDNLAEVAGVADVTHVTHGRAWAAVMPQAAAIDAGLWFGCATDAAASVEVVGDAVQLRRAAESVAQGRLAPAGRGFGLLIERLAAGLAQGSDDLAAAA
jgi:hypothetical protein